MKPTNEEVRAAIENGLAMLDDQGFPTDAAILRAHLETLDEERAFQEAAMKWGAWYNDNFRSEESWSQEEGDMLRAYRALVAKREEK